MRFPFCLKVTLVIPGTGFKCNFLINSLAFFSFLDNMVTSAPWGISSGISSIDIVEWVVTGGEFFTESTNRVTRHRSHFGATSVHLDLLEN